MRGGKQFYLAGGTGHLPPQQTQIIKDYESVAEAMVEIEGVGKIETENDVTLIFVLVLVLLIAAIILRSKK